MFLLHVAETFLLDYYVYYVIHCMLAPVYSEVQSSLKEGRQTCMCRPTSIKKRNVKGLNNLWNEVLSPVHVEEKCFLLYTIIMIQLVTLLCKIGTT